MTPDQIDRILEYIVRTGEFLATEAFSMAMKQVMVNSIIAGGFIVLFLTIFLFTGISALKFAELINAYHADELDIPYRMHDRHEESYAVFGTVSIVSFVFSCIISPLFLGWLLNPQWHAIKLLMGTFLP